MRAFLCSIDDSVWDAVEIGWTRLEVAKSTWDKAALAAANANSKALNTIFYGVSRDEFHRISHVTIAKEVWQILETTYEGNKKVKDTKLQMLTTHFKELKISEDESFDSFYGKLNEVVFGKFNLGEKTEDSKIVRKILRSLPESFRAKVTIIKESKDLNEIKIQELIDSLQTYELSIPSQRKSKSLSLKTINERLEAKTSRMRMSLKRKWHTLLRTTMSAKDSKDSTTSQAVTCYECKGHGHVQKECPTYLKAKGKVFATTLSDSNDSNSDLEENCDEEGNYTAFMAIEPMDSSEDLSLLMEVLDEHSEVVSIGIGEESDNEDEEAKGLQESYNSLLKKTEEYARVAKAALRKMKKTEQDYKSILMRHKETKCEVEVLNEELTEAYSKIKFLELEVIQANAKMEHVSSKKLDEVLTHQKPFF